MNMVVGGWEKNFPDEQYDVSESTEKTWLVDLDFDQLMIINNPHD